MTELAAPIDSSLAAVSKHIAVLEAAGIVKRTIAGRNHLLSLEAEPLAGASGWLEFYRKFWEQRLDLLEARLRERKGP